jgi:hypothetical protein
MHQPSNSTTALIHVFIRISLTGVLPRRQFCLAVGAVCTSARENLATQVIARLKALGVVSVKSIAGASAAFKIPLPKGLRLWFEVDLGNC